MVREKAVKLLGLAAMNPGKENKILSV